MSQGNFEWETKTDVNNLSIIARCGKWQAELAIDEPYVPGLIFVKQPKPGKLFPSKLGEDGKSIDDLKNLFELIHKIPTRMREYLTCTVHGNHCRCTNVYLLSLNENIANSPLHFRLWPRYDHDDYYLELVNGTGQEADALALMAKRRHQFLIKISTNRWGNWPPSRKGNSDAWIQYALNIKQMIIPTIKSNQTIDNNQPENNEVT